MSETKRRKPRTTPGFRGRPTALLRALARAKMTASDLAMHVGVDKSSVHRWLARRASPTALHRLAILDLLGPTALDDHPESEAC